MKQKNSPQIRVKKIPLEYFIDTLMDLYMGGVVYIDIVGTPHPKNDILNIIVKDEYIGEEEDYYEEEPPLTDETLNLLI
jgi:hypothetical protein